MVLLHLFFISQRFFFQCALAECNGGGEHRGMLYNDRGLCETNVIPSLMVLPVSDDDDDDNVGSFGEHKWHLNNRLIEF